MHRAARAERVMESNSPRQSMEGLYAGDVGTDYLDELHATPKTPFFTWRRRDSDYSDSSVAEKNAIQNLSTLENQMLVNLKLNHAEASQKPEAYASKIATQISIEILYQKTCTCTLHDLTLRHEATIRKQTHSAISAKNHSSREKSTATAQDHVYDDRVYFEQIVAEARVIEVRPLEADEEEVSPRLDRRYDRTILDGCNIILVEPVEKDPESQQNTWQRLVRSRLPLPNLTRTVKVKPEDQDRGKEPRKDTAAGVLSAGLLTGILPGLIPPALDPTADGGKAAPSNTPREVSAVQSKSFQERHEQMAEILEKSQEILGAFIPQYGSGCHLHQVSQRFWGSVDEIFRVSYSKSLKTIDVAVTRSIKRLITRYYCSKLLGQASSWISLVSG